MAVNHWHALEQTRPILDTAARRVAQQVRGQRWLVLQNAANGEHARVDAEFEVILDALDGSRRLGDIVAAVAPDAGETERLEIADMLMTLAQVCLVSFGDEKETERLLKRSQLDGVRRKRQRLNPLNLRFPVLDPDAQLECWRWLGAWLFSRRGAWIASGLWALAALVLVSQFSAIGSELDLLVGSPAHWWKYLLLFPALKLVHEMAHAMALKRWGGSVHELGISLLVLMPVPYVDAADVWMLRERFQRVMVCAAGIIAELTLAAIGLLLWYLTPNSLIGEIGFATALLAAIGTFLFNANPLLRFDGYQILQDLMQLPNLGVRSTAYLRYLFARYVLSVKDARAPIVAHNERPWLIGYGVASSIYRVMLAFVIAWYLYGAIPLLGLLLAAFTLVSLLLPVKKFIAYVLFANELQGRRLSVGSATATAALVLLGFAVLVPLPYHTRLEGVVGVPGQAAIMAEEDAEIVEVALHDGQEVTRNQPLLTLHSEQLEREIRTTQSELDTLQIEMGEARVVAREQLVTLRQQIADTEERLDSLGRRRDNLSIVAPVDGRVALANANIVAGARIRRGDRILYLVSDDEIRVHSVLPQKQKGRFDKGIRDVNVRLADNFGIARTARLVRQTPSADRRLPSDTLAYNGRRGIAVARTPSGELETLDPVFHLEFALPGTKTARRIGGRAYLNIAHPPTTMAERGWRMLRQLFLKTSNT